MTGLVLIVIGIVSTLLNGLALKVLWGWFISPIFNLHPLSIVQAIGLSLVISLMTNQHIPRDDAQRKEGVVYELLAPVMALIVGEIVHQFM